MKTRLQTHSKFVNQLGRSITRLHSLQVYKLCHTLNYIKFRLNNLGISCDLILTNKLAEIPLISETGY